MFTIDIDFSVTENGGLRLRSGEQRFYKGIIGFKFPMMFSGYADVSEWYDDADNKFMISVEVKNKVWGKLFHYKGSFDAAYIPVDSEADIPQDVRPVREEIRD